jgi:hypothetical protein
VRHGPHGPYGKKIAAIGLALCLVLPPLAALATEPDGYPPPSDKGPPPQNGKCPPPPKECKCPPPPREGGKPPPPPPGQTSGQDRDGRPPPPMKDGKCPPLPPDCKCPPGAGGQPNATRQN